MTTEKSPWRKWRDFSVNISRRVDATSTRLGIHISAHVYTRWLQIARQRLAKFWFWAIYALFPNLSQTIRDAAHAIRIAVSPLHFDALFGAVWKEIADRSHSLLADVMNSTKNHKILEMIQTDCMKTPSDARPLTVVLKHFGFAKQRMDSSVNPIAKVAMLLLVV